MNQIVKTEFVDFKTLVSKNNNISLNVICSETRPYLQGTKLTSWCAAQLGFEVHVITDGMGAMAVRLFNLNNIEVILGAAGNIEEVLNEYLKGSLLSTGSSCSHDHGNHEHHGH